MACFKGYKFTSEQDAKFAISEINKFFGIPSHEHATTQTYCDHLEHKDGFFYIVFLEELSQILGKPTDIESSNNLINLAP